MENENKKIKVIIADNSDKTREELSSYLSDEFDVVAKTGDGEELINLLTNNTCDIVIMDLVLSKFDGFTVLERMKGKMPKVIVTSSLSHEGFISKAMNMGVAYFLVKPTDFETLKQRAKEVCQSKTSTLTNIEKQKNRVLEEKISNIFITVGIPAHIKGYQFLREAIKMAIDNPEIINSITKKLYPSIADRFETSSSKVERAIRHAIEVAWNRGKIENINNLFGLKVYSSNEKPTNGEFIALVADKMILENY